ncbi:MAG: hypothetical protein AAGI48_04150 [Verrucomicrobiota bacterium]
MLMKLPEFADHLHLEQGFCHPDWEAIGRLVEEGCAEPDWDAAWEAVARRWLEKNGEILGAGYGVHESENFMILTEALPTVVEDSCQAFERSLSEILERLGGIALDEGYGKHVVMMFRSTGDYYGYISRFHPDGDHPMSGGVCLGHEGYLHFAFPTPEYDSYRTVLVHELTHGCLRHLPLPAWIDEAMAMRMEELVCGTNVFHLDREVMAKHLTHWNAETIQQFWSGQSWRLPGESFELSYNLAQILWRKVEADVAPPKEVIVELMNRVDWDDGGDAAFRSVLGFSLGELAEDFLGEGDWEPKPESWDASTAEAG